MATPTLRTQSFTYGTKTVSFDLARRDAPMINATEMAKIFDKLVADFLRLDQTKSFIAECLSYGKSHNSNAGNVGYSIFSDIHNESDLLRVNQRHGTWMHRILALKFAAWLDPAFELWVYATVEELLFGPHRAESDLLRQRADLSAQMRAIELDMADDPRFLKLSNLKARRKQVNHRLNERQKQQYALFEEEFLAIPETTPL